MDPKQPDKFYYNAVAVACSGDRAAIARFYKKFGRGGGAWERTWKAISKLKMPPSMRRVDPYKEWEMVLAARVRLIMFKDDNFPSLLREIPDPPFGIFVRGNLYGQTEQTISAYADSTGMPTLNSLHSSATAAAIAIVGTRRATPEGKTAAGKFARKLAENGFTIVSGLALGVDAAAHAGALEAGIRGSTIAVLAGGLHEIYPKENVKIAEKILADGGGLISEYPLGIPPYPSRFLERNRIVSGLSIGALIIEAPRGSGSIATARYALEQNRDVFVIPGPITSPKYEGSHELIRKCAAELVTKPEDILDAYGIDADKTAADKARDESTENRLILDALRSISKPLDIDKISSITKLQPQTVNRAIAFLLTGGIVKETEAGYIIK